MELHGHDVHPRPFRLDINTSTRGLSKDLPRKSAALATSVGSVSRPSGTLPKKFFTFSGVNGTPTKVSNKPVPLSSGSRLLTRICFGPYSAARPLVACHPDIVSNEPQKETGLSLRYSRPA
jgi:hypothetical protein